MHIIFLSYLLHPTLSASFDNPWVTSHAYHQPFLVRDQHVHSAWIAGKLGASTPKVK